MFNFTPEERRVILFLITMALLGLGVNFSFKVNSRIQKVLKIDERLTKINLNQASLKDLLEIPGLSPKLAQGIITYRNQQGAFRDIEELKELKGIGDYRYEKLKDLFFVDE